MEQLSGFQKKTKKTPKKEIKKAVRLKNEYYQEKELEPDSSQKN